MNPDKNQAGKVNLIFEQSQRALGEEFQRAERLTAKSEVYLVAGHCVCRVWFD